MFVLYCFDANYIHVKVMYSRTGCQILLAYQQVHKMFVVRGFRPSLEHLYNEALAALIAYLGKEQVEFQLTLASTHRHNSTK